MNQKLPLPLVRLLAAAARSGLNLVVIRNLPTGVNLANLVREAERQVVSTVEIDQLDILEPWQVLDGLKGNRRCLILDGLPTAQLQKKLALRLGTKNARRRPMTRIYCVQQMSKRPNGVIKDVVEPLRPHRRLVVCPAMTA